MSHIIMARTTLIVSLCALGLATATTSASIIADYDPLRHDRFIGGGPAAPAGNVPNPGFLLGGEDLTGVGVGQFGGTLISPRHVLAAAHFGSGTSTYSFVNAAGNRVDIAGSFETILTTSGTPSDVTIITLSRDITPADLLTPFSIAIGEATDIDLANIEVFGYGQENRVGRNIVDGGTIPGTTTNIPPILTASFAGGSSPTIVAAYDFDTTQNGGTNGVGGDEIGLTGGDSGHALLTFVQNGDLALVGAHFGIATNGGTPSLDLNYISLSSVAAGYRTQIESVVNGAGHDVSFVQIPEPATLSLLAFAPVALLRRRRVA